MNLIDKDEFKKILIAWKEEYEASSDKDSQIVSDMIRQFCNAIDDFPTISRECLENLLNNSIKTRGDVIRHMPDEQLADVLRCNQCIYQGMPECERNDCDYGILAWLRKDCSDND